MYGAKKMAEIQSGLKPTSASDKREGPSDKREGASDKRTRKRLVVFDISRW